MSQAPQHTGHARTGRLRVGVVTPEGAVFDGEAASVVVPGKDGEVAFYPLHAAYVGSLGCGELRIVKPGGEIERWVLEGGVAEVAHDQVTVLADRVSPLARIDVEKVKADLAKAIAGVPADEVAEALRDEAIEVAQVKLRLAGRGAAAAPH